MAAGDSNPRPYARVVELRWRNAVKTRLPIAVLLVVLAASGAFAQRDKNQPAQRSLQGQVMGHNDAPLEKAIVYLKNTRSLAVKTYITDANGNYQFNSLTPNTDYEVYADYNGQKSDTKTLSGFDSRPKAFINLHISVNKQ